MYFNKNVNHKIFNIRQTVSAKLLASALAVGPLAKTFAEEGLKASNLIKLINRVPHYERGNQLKISHALKSDLEMTNQIEFSSKQIPMKTHFAKRDNLS